MKKKAVVSALLATSMISAFALGCGNNGTTTTQKPSSQTSKDSQKPASSGTEATKESEKQKETESQKPTEKPKESEKPVEKELPTVTFTHGYYHAESEWAPAAEMRKIYQEFADQNKNEFNFVVKADNGGAEGIYNTALNDLSAGKFYDIADFGGWDITGAGAGANAILDLKPYLDKDKDLKEGVGICYTQNLTEDGKIYSVREQVEGVGFWYNSKLFEQAGATTPDKWTSWKDFDAAVEKLKAANIVPFSLNAGWPTNILVAGYSQRDEASRKFYQNGKKISSFDDPAFKGTMEFLKNNVLGKIEAKHFGPGGDDDNQYTTDFINGDSAMHFNGVWATGDFIDCKADIANLKPAVFPTDDGKKAGLLSGGCGFVVSSKLSDEQKDICIKFIKYMTSPEIASRIVKNGIGMVPSTTVDYNKVVSSIEKAEGKLLVEACQLLQKADFQVLGWGNTFGDSESRIQSKYAGLKDGSKTVDDMVKELDKALQAAE